MAGQNPEQPYLPEAVWGEGWTRWSAVFFCKKMILNLKDYKYIQSNCFKYRERVSKLYKITMYTDKKNKVEVKMPTKCHR